MNIEKILIVLIDIILFNVKLIFKNIKKFQRVVINDFE